jgi:hypothetical protein
VIDRFNQPLKSILVAVNAVLSGFGMSLRKQFVVGQQIYKWWMILWRFPTRRWRTLPDVLLIGVSKAGTSTIAAHLARHPQFHPPLYKEPHYFDLHPHEDLSWYRAYFPLTIRRWLIDGLGGTFVTGDFTPSYYLLPHAAERIRRELRHPRIILSLRNPIDRAYSHFKDSRSIGYEILDRFEDALLAEPHRLRGELDKMERDPNYCSSNVLSFGYKTRGLYVDYLRRWRQHFDADEMLVLDFEDWKRNPADTYARICDFLKLRRTPIADFTAYNVNAHVFPEVVPQTRRQLAEFFEPHNRELYRLLGTDFGWR